MFRHGMNFLKHRKSYSRAYSDISYRDTGKRSVLSSVNLKLLPRSGGGIRLDTAVIPRNTTLDCLTTSASFLFLFFLPAVNEQNAKTDILKAPGFIHWGMNSFWGDERLRIILGVFRKPLPLLRLAFLRAFDPSIRLPFGPKRRKKQTNKESQSSDIT